MLISHKTKQQFIKFWFGGWLYFWSGYMVFALCYSLLKLHWFYAKVIADVVGWSLNYIAQRYWAFKSDFLLLNERQHVSRYLLIESIGFFIDYAIIAGLNAVGITPYIGIFISAGFFSIWSFFWYKFYVFPQKKRLS